MRLRARRPFSFRARLTLRWTLAFGLVLAVANVVVYLGARSYLYRDFDTKVRTLGATELASAVDESGGIHLHDFPVEAFGDDEYADKFSQLFDARGTVLMRSPSVDGLDGLLGPDAIAEAIANRAPIVSVRAGPREGRMVGLRAEYDGLPYVIGVGIFTDRLEGHLARLAWLLVGVWATGLAVTAAVGFGLASRALAPVDHITTRAARIARGDIDARLDPPPVDDEIGRMTGLLNDMLDRLHAVIEANRRFAADASHELRSPLTAMVGEVDVTLKRERTPEEYRGTLALVRERLTEMAELTDNLMTLVRAQEGAADRVMREVPVTPLVEGAVKRVARLAASRGIAIERRALDPLVVYGDARLLARAVDNLVANAVQYNRDGGRVVVAGCVEEVEADSWRPATVVLTVEDTGPGVPPAAWERIFDRFYRLDESRSRATGGSGLGLSICRAAASVFGGTVRVSASSPHGTTFELRLPGRGPLEGQAGETQAFVDPQATARVTCGAEGASS